LLQALLPGLKARASKLLRRQPERPTDPPALERGELWQVLFVSLLERIQTYPLEKRPRKIASNLLWDVEHVTLGELERARTGLNELPKDEPLEVPAPGEVPADVEALIQDAVAAAAISAAEAELIAETYLEGVALGEVARRLGLPYNAVKVRRQNAVRGLLIFLNEQAEFPYLEVDPDSRRKRPTSVRMHKRRSPRPKRPGRPPAAKQARTVRAVPDPELSFEQGGHTSEGT
jgi:DNA-directed RNA polymerase specialized sigma24 family protein